MNDFSATDNQSEEKKNILQRFSHVFYDQLIGLEYTSVTPDCVKAQCEITTHHHQPTGIVHGGVYCSISESVASVAGTTWLCAQSNSRETDEYFPYCVGTNNNTDFMKAFRKGVLYAIATPLHRGRSQQLWQVDLRDADDLLYAQTRIRLHNIYP